jgi:hypothetical protein
MGAGGQHCYTIFDMRNVAWANIAPLFGLPLAIFNAVCRDIQRPAELQVTADALGACARSRRLGRIRKSLPILRSEASVQPASHGGDGAAIERSNGQTIAPSYWVRAQRRRCFSSNYEMHDPTSFEISQC